MFYVVFWARFLFFFPFFFFPSAIYPSIPSVLRLTFSTFTLPGFDFFADFFADRRRFPPIDIIPLGFY